MTLSLVVMIHTSLSLRRHKVKMKKIIITLIILIQTVYAQEHYYYKNNTKVPLYEYNSHSRNTENIDYYKNEKGILLGVTDKIIVKCKQTGCLKNYILEFNLTSPVKLGNDLYAVKVTHRSLTLDTANKLSQKDDIAYAHPDFIKKQLSR